MTVPDYMKKGLFWLLISGTIILSLVRFIHLNADFPTEISRSGAMYTDEGWYAKNAVWYHLTGDWYAQYDMNYAVSLPVLPFFHGISFSLLGVGIGAARTTIILFFIGSLAMVYVLLRKYEGDVPAALGVFLLSANYFLFSFSRMALGEIPFVFFVLVSLFLVLKSNERPQNLFYPAGAALCFTLAFFTKTNAVFALFVTLVLFWIYEKRTHKTYRSLLFTGIWAGLFVLHFLLLARPYYEDYVFFHSMNVGLNIEWGFLDYVRFLWRVVRKGYEVDFLLYTALPLVLGFAAWKKRSFFHRPLVISSLAWMVFYLGLLSLYGNNQPRYYPPLAFPLVILSVSIMNAFCRDKKCKPMQWFLIVVIGGSMIWNIIKVSGLLRSPSFTMQAMAHDIQNEAVARGYEEPVLLSHLASTVALYNGMLPVNDHLAPYPLAYRMKKYNPHFYLDFEKNPGVVSHLERRYNLLYIKSYSLFDGEVPELKLFELVSARE